LDFIELSTLYYRYLNRLIDLLFLYTNLSENKITIRSEQYYLLLRTTYNAVQFVRYLLRATYFLWSSGNTYNNHELELNIGSTDISISQ